MSLRDLIEARNLAFVLGVAHQLLGRARGPRPRLGLTLRVAVVPAKSCFTESRYRRLVYRLIVK